MRGTEVAKQETRTRPRVRAKTSLEGGDEVVLRARPPLHLDVRAVREQREHAAVAPGAEGLDVGLLVRGGTGAPS